MYVKHDLYLHFYNQVVIWLYIGHNFQHLVSTLDGFQAERGKYGCAVGVRKAVAIVVLEPVLLFVSVWSIRLRSACELPSSVKRLATAYPQVSFDQRLSFPQAIEVHPSHRRSWRILPRGERTVPM